MEFLVEKQNTETHLAIVGLEKKRLSENMNFWSLKNLG